MDALLSADERRRSAVSRADSLRGEQKALGKQVGKAQGDERAALLAKGKELAAEKFTPASVVVAAANVSLGLVVAAAIS